MKSEKKKRNTELFVQTLKGLIIVKHVFQEMCSCPTCQPYVIFPHPPDLLGTKDLFYQVELSMDFWQVHCETDFWFTNIRKQSGRMAHADHQGSGRCACEGPPHRHISFQEILLGGGRMQKGHTGPITSPGTQAAPAVYADTSKVDNARSTQKHKDENGEVNMGHNPTRAI